jgi:hypothetical protein
MDLNLQVEQQETVVVISTLDGDQLETFDDMNGIYYGVYDCSANHTLVFGTVTNAPTGVPTYTPTSSPTSVPTLSPTSQPTMEPTPSPTSDPTASPPTGISCPPVGETTVIELGSTMMVDLQIPSSSSSESVCALVEVDTASIGTTDEPNMKLVGRSYSGKEWESYAGPFSSTTFDCTGGSSTCSVTLPTPKTGRSYVMKQFSFPHSRSQDDLVARFLEKTTFGPTKDEIASFTTPAEWIASQLEQPMTSHRAFWRERVTAWHSETNFHTLLHTDACSEGARYRKYAFITTDVERMVEFEQSDVDPSKIIVSVDGVVRTIVDGPIGTGSGSEITFPDVPMGEYYICSTPLEGIYGRVRIEGPDGCRDVYFNQEYGNPRVQYDATLLPGINAVDLEPAKTVPVLSGRFSFRNAPEKEDEEEMLQLTVDLTNPSCPENSIPGAPEMAVFGVSSDGNGNNEYWLHSTSLDLVNNDMAQPLPDGGKSRVTKTAGTVERMQAVCSNVPRTFLNEDSCFLSSDACTLQEIEDVDIVLSLESLQEIYNASGRYVYAVEGLRNEYPLVDYPCSPGVRSRWMEVALDACTNTVGSIATSTASIFVGLIKTSNGPLQDVFFPLNGVSCDPSDASKFDFNIQVGASCFVNVHPDYHQVMDFTYWVENHPGNSEPDFNPIKDIAEDPNASFWSWSVITPFVLSYPDWHSMQRWHSNKQNFPSLGKLGDQTTFRALPAELTRPDIALAFGADYKLLTSEDGFVVVCGSPNEVASSHSAESAPFSAGGFDMET